MKKIFLGRDTNSINKELELIKNEIKEKIDTILVSIYDDEKECAEIEHYNPEKEYKPYLDHIEAVKLQNGAIVVRDHSTCYDGSTYSFFKVIEF
jgi:hypothetical protein